MRNKYEYICKNGNKILSEVELPKKRWNGKMSVDRISMIGMSFDIECDNTVYSNVKILEYICKEDKNYQQFKIEFNNNIYIIHCGSFMNGHFRGVLGRYTYKYEIGKVLDNGLKILKRGKKYGRRAYNTSCNKCGFDGGKHYKNGELVEEYLITEHNLDKSGCACCANQIVVEGINDIYTTDYWMVELGVDEEYAKSHTRCSHEKAPCKCPCCGEIRYKKTSGIYNDKSISCVCGDGFSYPEKFMYNILRQIDVEFEMQYSPYYLTPDTGNKYRKYSDFYLKEYKLVIEVDGGMGHKGGIVHSSSDKTIYEYIEMDNWKDEQHLKHGIKTVRINCFKSDMEYIKENILNSKLVELFYFNSVNWNKANEYAWRTNLRKEVCHYWDQKEEWETTTDLAKIFDISRVTILMYLKKDKSCNYNPKEEKRKRSSKAGKMNKKLIEIFKDGISLGIFESATELERQSEELFGVKLWQANISSVCLGKRKSHNGFTFKYIED